MRKKLLAGLATGLFWTGMAAMANATVITFDEYTNVDYSGGEVTGVEWISDGILFSTPDLELNIGYTTGSSPNSLGASVNSGDFDGSVYFEFIDYKYVTDLSFTIFNTPFQASAYDVSGNLLTTLVSGSDFTQYFDFSGYNVNSVQISGSEYAIDDVTFTELHNSNPVPEPTTMLLFSTGLAGLVGNRLRRKKKK